MNLSRWTAFNSPASRHLRTSARGRAHAGFTLLELMIVIAIVMILATIAGTNYQRSVTRSREAVLKTDLAAMRNAIQAYTLDKEAGPSSLDDLVQARYLTSVPIDPMTRNRDWHTESEQVLLDPQQTTPGVTDVHSSSNEVSPFENTAYNTW